MRCLVLGGSGYVGQHLCPTLADKCDTLYTYNTVGVSQMGEAHGGKMDLQDPSSVRAVMRSRPTVVINLAALANLADCETRPSVAEAVNGCTNLELPNSVTHYIYVSSDIVYGGHEGAITESTEPAPSCVYGRTKLMGEKWAENWATAAPSTRHYAIIRPSVIYGKKGLVEGTKDTFVQDVVGKMSTKVPINAFEDEIRCPTFVGDIVDLIKNLVLNSSEKSMWDQAYNLGSDPVSRFEMATTVHSALQKRNVYTDAQPVTATSTTTASFSYTRPRVLQYAPTPANKIQDSNVTRALRRPVTGLVDGVLQVLLDELGRVMEDPFVYDAPRFAADDSKNPRLNLAQDSNPLHFKARCAAGADMKEIKDHQLFDAAAWSKLHEGELHFGEEWGTEDRPMPVPFSCSTSTEEERKETEDLRLRMDKEGFVLLDEARVPWFVDKRKIAEGIHRCVQYGYHPIWMWASDELWLMAHQMLPKLKNAYQSDLVLDCWAWFVDCQNPGWYPHRDRSSTAAFYPIPTGEETAKSDSVPQTTATAKSPSASSDYKIPGYITCWVPLTDVNPETGCLYCLPADRDMGYRASSGSVEDYMVDPRLYRALPTNGAVLFSHRLLHWGSRPSAMAPNPRMSLFFAVAKDDFESPCFARKHLPLPPLALRVGLIAGHRLIYSTHVKLSKPDAELMWRLVETQLDEFHPTYIEKVKRSPAFKLLTEEPKDEERK